MWSNWKIHLLYWASIQIVKFTWGPGLNQSAGDWIRSWNLQWQRKSDPQVETSREWVWCWSLQDYQQWSSMSLWFCKQMTLVLFWIWCQWSTKSQHSSLLIKICEVWENTEVALKRDAREMCSWERLWSWSSGRSPGKEISTMAACRAIC